MLEKILEDNNFDKAIRKVVSNKGISGVDGKSCEESECFYIQRKVDIKWLILTERYTPCPIKRTFIPKSDGNRRQLGIPNAFDRFLQQAILQIINPLFEKDFSNYSFGFRKNKSCEDAIKVLLQYFNSGYNYVVNIDIEKFFDNINHELLMSFVKTKIIDTRVTRLLEKYLKSKVFYNNELFDTNVGAPQGGNLSPLLSNIYLDKLDKFVESKNLKFVRYADDFVILATNKNIAEEIYVTIKDFLQKELKLKVNEDKSKITNPEDLKYLGFGFEKVEGRYIPKIHWSKLEKFHLKMVRLLSREHYYDYGIEQVIKEVQETYLGTINYYKIVKVEHLLKYYDRLIYVRFKLNSLKNYKNTNTKYHKLVSIGLNDNEIKNIMNGKRKDYFENLNKLLEEKFESEYYHIQEVYRAKKIKMKFKIIDNEVSIGIIHYLSINNM